MNRVEAAIQQTSEMITTRLADGLVDQTKIDNLHRTLNMEFLEFCRFQELKSLAVASGKLSLEEGMTIFGLLGETPEHFNRQSVAAKSVLTRIFAELMGTPKR